MDNNYPTSECVKTIYICFDNIYKYGIKGTAEKVGAYAERVDEQNYIKGTLDRIFNQISKADVIVADMTGRNPNVYYEVGYAHALGKIVLLLTQNTEDIPFDLKHRPHTPYNARDIKKLEGDLTQKLIWAISESSKKGKRNLLESLLVSLPEVEIPEAKSSNNVPIIEINFENEKIILFPIMGLDDNKLILKFSIRNLSPEPIYISFVYLFTSGEVASEKLNDDDRFWQPLIGIDNFNTIDGLSKQFKVSHNIPPLPFEAVEQLQVEIGYFKEILDKLYKLRIHILSGNFHDFPFRIKVDIRRGIK